MSFSGIPPQIGGVASCSPLNTPKTGGILQKRYTHVMFKVRGLLAEISRHMARIPSTPKFQYISPQVCGSQPHLSGNPKGALRFGKPLNEGMGCITRPSASGPNKHATV